MYDNPGKEKTQNLFFTQQNTFLGEQNFGNRHCEAPVAVEAILLSDKEIASLRSQ
jgi:hypothetical protein